MKTFGQFHAKPKTILFSLCIAVAMTAPSYGYAQDDAETDDADAVEEVVVTGYRGALINSIDAKRESTGFTDAIFADDLGKMPSQNLAESLNRVPGVKINREITGEGLKIANWRRRDISICRAAHNRVCQRMFAAFF